MKLDESTRKNLPAVAALAFALTAGSAGADDELKVERRVMVPMRDGVRLATDVYGPAGLPGKMPAVLIRTAYGKQHYVPGDDLSAALVERGYAVVVQDLRGRFASEGVFRPGRGDRRDGYDTVTWITEQAWSDGKVGTAGCSYQGEVQIALAAERHPNHLAAAPMAASTGSYAEGRPWVSYDGGVFELAQTAGWFAMAGHSEADPDLKKYFSLLSSLPTIDLLARAGLPPTEYESFRTAGPEGQYFRDLEWTRFEDRFDVPMLFVDSWYDYGVAEALQLFNHARETSVSERARENQFMIVAPSGHCGYPYATENTVIGERELGDARLDFLGLQLDWYDHWLKGADNGVTERPRLLYYVMGKNVWEAADAWPVPGTQLRKLYLSSGGRANSRYGDGRLAFKPPADAPFDHFVYDPATPVPSLGGQSCCTGTDTESGGYDQSAIEMRHDVLVYTSDVLQEGIEVTGPLVVVLQVSSSAKDTDVTAKLVDVYPDGRAFNVQEGALRMRYREGYEKTLTMTPGEVYEARLDLHATSNYFGTGHRIRLEVSSSNFPRWERNLNTGGDNYDETRWEVAKNGVHHGPERPSYVLLPVVE